MGGRIGVGVPWHLRDREVWKILAKSMAWVMGHRLQGSGKRRAGDALEVPARDGSEGGCGQVFRGGAVALAHQVRVRAQRGRLEPC